MNDDFLDQLAQPRPDPGGGAAAAHGSMLGLAIMEKIARLETARADRGDGHATWKELLQHVGLMTKEFRSLRQRDCDAYMKLAQARGASSTPEQQLEAAWAEAIRGPMAIMEASVAALQLLAQIGKRSSKHLIADLQVASEFLSAGCRGACHIARSNVSLLARHNLEDRYSESISALLSQMEKKLDSVREQLQRVLTA